MQVTKITGQQQFPFPAVKVFATEELLKGIQLLYSAEATEIFT